MDTWLKQQGNSPGIQDLAKKAGQQSIFSTANREWLESDNDAKFVTPTDLTNILNKNK